MASLSLCLSNPSPGRRIGTTRKKIEKHDFPGYGSYAVHTTPSPTSLQAIEKTLLSPNPKLTELEATSISGNDILSSSFYVTGLVTLSAGKFAPICLLAVGSVLFVFRGIYEETVTSLPCNGGTYNVLLNCTSKQFASMAACFAIIAYITTGVVSALTAVAYLRTISGDWLGLEISTIALLFVFFVLTSCGISDSAQVAKVIYLAHCATLSMLCVFGVLYMVGNSEVLMENLQTPFPKVNVAGENVAGTAFTALFYGFSSAMLGVSGFETSSQFIEEQAEGVFPLTLKNMWQGVIIFNPLLSLISFAALPIEVITKNKDTVLAGTAKVIGHWIKKKLHFPEHWQIGEFLSFWVSVDAFVVLAGAVLTSYVGINGLIRRMAMDRCLPQVLLYKNPYTNTDTLILLSFFVLCISQVILLDCDVEALGGVYCYAFLSVMSIFAFGNMILKVKRPSLPRAYKSSWIASITGFLSVVTALLGNVLGKPELLTYFFVYFMVIGALIILMFNRVNILRILLFVLKEFGVEDDQGDEDETDIKVESIREGEQAVIMSATRSPEWWWKRGAATAIHESERAPSKAEVDLETATLLPNQYKTSKRTSLFRALVRSLHNVKDVPFIFFAKHDDLYVLNKAVLYVRNNEQTSKLIIVHCTADTQDTKSMSEHVRLIDVLYPKIKISLLIVEGQFRPSLVEWLSIELGVPVNAMFISCPDKEFSMRIQELRGMRIIST